MSCAFGIGSRVRVGNVCGTVVDANDFGNDVRLAILLPGGAEPIQRLCSTVGPCDKAASAPCGRETVSGGLCKRIVAGRGRCYQH